MTNRTILTALWALAAAAQSVRYTDPASGLEVVEIDPPGARTTNLYYHFSNFVAGDRGVLFAADAQEGPQLFLYDPATGKTRQVTRGAGWAASAACPHPADARLVYIPRGWAIEEVNIESGRVRRVGEAPEPRTGGLQQPSMTPDNRSLAVARQRDASNWEIGLMDISTGAWRSVVTAGFRIGHVQHHPSLPLIFFVWETGGYAPQRTWLAPSDGGASRPFYYTTDPKLWLTPLKEWVTHESWIPATGELTMVVDKTGIVITDAGAAAHPEKAQFIAGHYWHVRASDDGRLLLADDFDGRLWLLERVTGNRRLIASGLRGAVRAVHAHASFSHSGRYVFFNTGRARQTVALIDLAKK